MFALVDCNNFYASCERIFRPDLQEKPIVVLSNNDGCVIARSNEAKAMGVPMGAPAFKFEKFFKEHQIHVFSANFALYGDMSQRVMSILEEFTPDMELYSIDEAFLKFKGFDKFDLKNYGEEMHQKILKCTGIPISIGIAPTKALAKVANLIAKKYSNKTKNVYLIDSEEKRIKALKWLAIKDVWGIGRKQSKRLMSFNINTAYDYTILSDEWVKRNLSIVGLRLKKDLEGKETLDLEPSQIKQSIATTRSFEKDYTQFEELKERVITYAVACSEKLRKQNSCCSSLMVFVRSNRHREVSQYNNSIRIDLPFPTNSGIELAKFATLALQRIFRGGYNYKKAGVVVMDLTPDQEQQLSLFSNSNPKHLPLMKVMDKLNHNYGQNAVRLAAQEKKRWKMKQEKLSPRYTTNLADIITIHC